MTKLVYLSTNCSLNQVNFGDYGCEVVSCTKNLITCNTKNVYETYFIDNSGSDAGILLLFLIY